MQWLSYAFLLACPLMMLFCMKGMSGGNKDTKTNQEKAGASQEDLQTLQIKMADLIEQNQKLTKEVESMKEAPSNAIELQEEKIKRVVS